jgi:hypothetical protein
MENVFEPMENFIDEVFEPVNNDTNDYFDPINFDGEEYSNFDLFNCGCRTRYAFNKEKRDECLKQCEVEKAQKKALKSDKTLKSEDKKNQGSSLTQPKTKTPIDIVGIIKTGTEAYTQLAPFMQRTDFQRNLEAVCGKSGTILGIGKPRQSYLTCAENFMKSQGVSNQQFDQWKNTLDTSGDNRVSSGDEEPKKGLSLGAKIGIGVGVLAVVGLIVYIATSSKGGKAVKGGKK